MLLCTRWALLCDVRKSLALSTPQMRPRCNNTPLYLFFHLQEVHSEEIDTDSAYILFYEQQGVNYSQFLPKIDGKKMADTSSMDEDFESDYKKYCVLQWPQLVFHQPALRPLASFSLLLWTGSARRSHERLTVEPRAVFMAASQHFLNSTANTDRWKGLLRQQRSPSLWKHPTGALCWARRTPISSHPVILAMT